MRRGTCVKCGAEAVRAGRNAVQLGDVHPVALRPHHDHVPRRIEKSFETEDVWAFACTTCGYLEFHILDEDTLEFIRRKWIEVPPT
jgi:predicted nucleic-acid-binding Zn-ribbon protein